MGGSLILESQIELKIDPFLYASGPLMQFLHYLGNSAKLVFKVASESAELRLWVLCVPKLRRGCDL